MLQELHIVCLVVMLQCVYCRLHILKGMHGSYNALISSKKAVHDLMVTYRIGSTKHVSKCGTWLYVSMLHDGSFRYSKVVLWSEYVG